MSSKEYFLVLNPYRLFLNNEIHLRLISIGLHKILLFLHRILDLVKGNKIDHHLLIDKNWKMFENNDYSNNSKIK